MKTITILIVACLFLLSGIFVEAISFSKQDASLMCIKESDNDEVKKFKYNIISLTLKEDLDSGGSLDSIITKYKYFPPCN